MSAIPSSASKFFPEKISEIRDRRKVWSEQIRKEVNFRLQFNCTLLTGDDSDHRAAELWPIMLNAR